MVLLAYKWWNMPVLSLKTLKTPTTCDFLILLNMFFHQREIYLYYLEKVISLLRLWKCPRVTNAPETQTYLIYSHIKTEKKNKYCIFMKLLPSNLWDFCFKSVANDSSEHLLICWSIHWPIVSTLLEFKLNFRLLNEPQMHVIKIDR